MGQVIDLTQDAMNNWAIPPNIYVASYQGPYVDFSTLGGGEIATAAFVNVGAYTAASPNISIQIEESTLTASNFTAIPGMTLNVTSTAQQNGLIGLRSKQYVRANMTTLTGTAFYLSCILLEGKKFVAAAGQQGGYDRYPSS